MGEQQCALWYWRHNVIEYEVYDSEAEAASAAVGMEDYGNGVPIGVQFPDGRTIRQDDWVAYRDAVAKARADEEARSARQKDAPPIPTRQVKDPFEGRPVTVEADEPEWLGVSPGVSANAPPD